jgi:hypothetical protein
VRQRAGQGRHGTLVTAVAQGYGGIAKQSATPGPLQRAALELAAETILVQVE